MAAQKILKQYGLPETNEYEILLMLAKLPHENMFCVTEEIENVIQDLEACDIIELVDHVFIRSKMRINWNAA